MDYNLFKIINNFAGESICLDSLAIFFSQYLVYFIVAGAVVVLFLIKNKKEQIKYLFFMGLSVFLSRIVFTGLIRLFWDRLRPFAAHLVNQLVEHSPSGSFPSGHTAFLFALSMAVFFFNKKIGIAFLILSFFVGLARVFIGVHYPLDILGGIIVGIISALIIRIFIKPKPITER